MVEEQKTYLVEIDVFTTRFRVEQCRQELQQLVTERRILYGPGWQQTAEKLSRQPAPGVTRDLD